MFRRARLVSVLACAAIAFNGLAAAAASPIAAEAMQSQEQSCHPVDRIQAQVPLAPPDDSHDCCAFSACHCATAQPPALILSDVLIRMASLRIVSMPPPRVALHTPPLPEPIRPPIV